MPFMYEANEPYENIPETDVRNRPPQLNMTVCGCRCGCGCCGVIEDNDGGQSDEDDEEFPPSVEGPENHVNTQAFEIRRQVPRYNSESPSPTLGLALERYLLQRESFRPASHVIRMQDHPFWRHENRSFRRGEDDADSMRCEPCDSDDQSEVSSDRRSVQCISPGPGLGAWADNDRMDGYHFLTTPLRLTPHEVTRREVGKVFVEGGSPTQCVCRC